MDMLLVKATRCKVIPQFLDKNEYPTSGVHCTKETIVMRRTYEGLYSRAQGGYDKFLARTKGEGKDRTGQVVKTSYARLSSVSLRGGRGAESCVVSYERARQRFTAES